MIRGELPFAAQTVKPYDAPMTANEVITLLNLSPLPHEGGYYRQTYNAQGLIPASALRQALAQHSGSRRYGSAIYYLITPESFSALHRLPQDELFHFYLGDPVEMLQITPTGEARECRLGHRIQDGETSQVIVPGNVWQGTRLANGGNWALLGCTVCPGFEFDDLQIATRDELCRLFPGHAAVICRFFH